MRVMEQAVPDRQGLYDPANEHDACGVGFVAHFKGQKSHSIVEQGLLILKNLDHRVPSAPIRYRVMVLVFLSRFQTSFIARKWPSKG
jgi:hypothetical protein